MANFHNDAAKLYSNTMIHRAFPNTPSDVHWTPEPMNRFGEKQPQMLAGYYEPNHTLEFASSLSASALEVKVNDNDSINMLADALCLSQLIAPEDPSDAYATQSRVYACIGMNHFLSRSSIYGIINFISEIQRFQDSLLTSSTHMTKKGIEYPVVNLYSNAPTENLGWLISPLPFQMHNLELKALIQYKTRYNPADPNATPLQQPNWFSGWSAHPYARLYIPFYEDYQTYIHATSLNIACHLYRADKNQFPKTLSELAPEYLPESIIREYSQKVRYEFIDDPDHGKTPCLVMKIDALKEILYNADFCPSLDDRIFLAFDPTFIDDPDPDDEAPEPDPAVTPEP